ncbi:MAG: hypothetical protein JWN99_197 [Ilumatobacteraceae bacterium]|nr:hypothetical protein [Ilumatobacteraceae bacterium]
MAKKGPKNPLSDQHKAAMAAGRTEGRAVREYLDALRSNKPKRGRKRTPDSINARLARIEDELMIADPLDELRLVQERRNLSRELETMSAGVDMTALEADFVRVAKAYSERQGISYATWRDVGVEAAVLKSAGISRAV